MLSLCSCVLLCRLLCRLQGSALSLVQDLPISKPLTASEINSLSGMVVLPSLCSFYSDLKGVQPRLAAAVDRMKALSGVVHVALCKVGSSSQPCLLRHTQPNPSGRTAVRLACYNQVLHS